MEGGQSGTYLRLGADQSSKAAFCKSAFAKSKLTFGKRAFAQSRFAFRQSIFASQKAIIWPSAKSKMLSAKTCQNVLESVFAFCQIGVRHVVSLTKESTFQQKRFCQKQLCQIGLRPALHSGLTVPKSSVSCSRYQFLIHSLAYCILALKIKMEI